VAKSHTTFKDPKTPGYERRASVTEKKIVRAMIETGSPSETAALVGVHQSTVQRVMKREPVLKFYMQALAEAGIDAKAIANVLKEALNAHKTVYVSDHGTPIAHDHIDHRTRLIAVDQITKTAMALRDIDKSLEEPDLTLPENVDEMTDVELAKLMTRRIIKRGS
jgi:hypothetical protein